MLKIKSSDTVMFTRNEFSQSCVVQSVYTDDNGWNTYVLNARPDKDTHSLVRVDAQEGEIVLEETWETGEAYNYVMNDEYLYNHRTNNYLIREEVRDHFRDNKYNSRRIQWILLFKQMAED